MTVPAKPALFEEALWEPTRAAALRRLDSFVPKAARAYAGNRNHDHGPADRSNVSALSPWIRHRALHEREVVRVVLERHGISSSEKFIQEVFWRAYFKGWLEQRPAVWHDYVESRNSLVARLDGDGELARRHGDAVSGNTGIECFDVWLQELIDTGYLHNHTRMWFASIWIFTLKLPWQLGADFFLRHLLDGDPASNTCSWRWVAGLHTIGKNYAARASNISKYANGRFMPEYQLATNPAPLDDGGNPEREPLPHPPAIDLAVPSLLVLHEDELSVANLPVQSWNLKGVLIVDVLDERSVLPIGKPVRSFVNGLISDSHNLVRHETGHAASVVTSMDGIADHARSCGVSQVIMPYAPTGPVSDCLARALPGLRSAGVTLGVHHHDYDCLTWPHATAGFFRLKSKLPAIIRQLGL